MKQDLRQLEVELIAGHQELEMVTKRVEELESRKDYLLLGEQISQASQTGEGEEARKEKQMVLFEKDCSRTFSGGQVEEIKNALTIICLSADLLLTQEEKMSAESKKRVEMVKREVWRIDGILTQKEKDKEVK